MVRGAVKPENAHVEPLTLYLPILPGYGIEARPVQLAHCLRALKQGLDALQTFGKVSAPPLILANMIYQGEMTGSHADRALMINKPPIQHPDCPDNGLLHFNDWEGMFERRMHDQRIQPKRSVSWPSSTKPVPTPRWSSISSTSTVGHTGKPPANTFTVSGWPHVFIQ